MTEDQARLQKACKMLEQALAALNPNKRLALEIKQFLNSVRNLK